jgi:hypothetical protein
MYNQFIPNNTDGKYESDGLVSGKPAKVKVQQQGGGGKNKIKNKK